MSYDYSHFALRLNSEAPGQQPDFKQIENPGFGNYFTDHMAHIQFRANEGVDEHLGVGTFNGKWTSHEVIPFGPLQLSPAASVLHYGQEVFEGLKAYRHSDGSIWTFRPEMNAARFNKSAARLGLPDLPESDFLASIAAVVSADKAWVPEIDGQALYIRPFMFASEPFLGVRAAHLVDYYCILSPAGAYFGKPEPVKIWVEEEYFRAGPGGTGFAKCGGNYAASLLPANKAFEKGCSQVLYTNARNQEDIEELGGMSFFVVYRDGSVKTPALNGNILASVTRDSVLTVLRDRGIQATEETLKLAEVIADIKSGEIVEAFACGTAAVVAPIGVLKNDHFEVSIGDGETEGELTRSIREEIVGIQEGELEDKRGWMVKVC